MTLNNEESKKAKQEKSNQPKEQKMKLKTQIVLIALALGVSTSLVSSQDRQQPQLPTAQPDYRRRVASGQNWGQL